MTASGGWFRRYLLPGLAFKSVVIGGGYATGRELAEFFLPSGPWGGLAAMALTMVVWSMVCVLTFLFARAVGASDYRTFIRHLLGRAWWLFEIAYLAMIVVVLAVFGAAAGELCRVMFGWPTLAGTLLLVAAIAAVVQGGNEAIERLFKYMSPFVYLVYAVAACLMLAAFGDRTVAQFAVAEAPAGSWALDGLTYAGYNIIGGIAILPVVRHMLRRRDAVIAGALAGPLAILPAAVFFLCMLAYAPELMDASLPSDVLLGYIGLPWFHLLFRLMILIALIETGVGVVGSVTERASVAWTQRTGAAPGRSMRLAGIVGMLLLAVFLADAIGLVRLIAQGYRVLAYGLLATYVVPLATIGVWKLAAGWRRPPAASVGGGRAG